MDIIIIAAMAANRVIGNKNAIPWSLPEDLRQFKAKTLGHTLIMGRKTFESLGRPLKGRHNIVLSRRPDLQLAGCTVVSDLNQALSLCKDQEKVFIIGGGEIFTLGLAVADTLILTLLEREVEGDTFFPDFSNQGFVETKREYYRENEPFTVITYRRPADKKL
jgi:dihydrofolate reductase